MLNLVSFNKLLKKKQQLLKCVFSSLIFQLFITAFIVFYLQENSTILNILKSNYLYSIALFLIGLFIIFILSSDKLSFNTKFMFFMFFGIIQGILLGSFKQYFPEDVVKSALISTITIFVTFLCVGFSVVYFNYDLTWMGIYLLMALLALLGYRISLIFIPLEYNFKKIMFVISILLFSIFIIYDTNVLLLKGKNKDCISFAMDYYLDILNIFSSFLNSE
tara:strand:- start:239 stop:898 length:660 start_codon:yes stop_codon:yes gene_type:complete